jgi:hypothetical protein
MAAVAEGHGLAAVEVHAHEVQLARQRVEGVGETAPAQHGRDVLLQAGAVEQPRGKSLQERQGEVGQARGAAGERLACRARQDARGARRPAGDLRRAQAEEQAVVPARAGTARGDGRVHLERRDARCEQGSHERAAAHPDVEVEVEDAAVEQVLERAQAADLVDGAGDAAARADQRRTSAPAGSTPAGLAHAPSLDRAGGQSMRAAVAGLPLAARPQAVELP